MHFAIVGTGYTGLIISKYLLSKGHTVTLYESNGCLGGVLQDKVALDEKYYNSCQYIDANSPYIHLLPKEKLHKFNHTYGSYTDIFGISSISFDFAGPVCDLDSVFPNNWTFNQNLNTNDNIKNRIAEYPPIISSAYKEWLTKIGINHDITHQNGLIGLQLSRIHLRKLSAKVREIRLNFPQLESLYGLPRNEIGLSEIDSYLPLEGYNTFFENWFSDLGNINISKPPIVLRTLITPGLDEKKNIILMDNKREKIEYDQAIWTGNPNPLIYCLTGNKLDSYAFKARILVGDLDINEDILPFYIQVFSKKTHILRIFLYNLSGKNKFTIEKAENATEGDDETIFLAKSILDKFRISLNLNLKQSFYQKRYFIHTKSDYMRIFNSYKLLKKNNIIMSGFHLYGRDSKIDFILKNLNAI